MMLEHLGEVSAAAGIERAIEAVLAAGIRTPDLGGSHGTDEVTDAVIESFISAETRE